MLVTIRDSKRKNNVIEDWKYRAAYRRMNLPPMLLSQTNSNTIEIFPLEYKIRFDLSSFAIFPMVFCLMACVSCAWSTQYDGMVLRCPMYLPYEHLPLVPSSILPSLFRFGSKCKATDLYQVCNFMLISSIVWPLVSYTECVKHRFDRFHLRNHRRKYF